jgi:membrane-bound metal-dependent hydrolase YbcI (DUF457 family)
MFLRTHLAITSFFVLLFFQYLQNPLIFVVVSIFATMMPDIDNRFSKIGHYKLSRIFNFFVRHRGITHSFSFLLIVSLFIFLFFKEILFAFVLGYFLHLLLDSLTVQGIMPLYPLKRRLRGIIRTGGMIENLIFVIFLSGNLFLIFTQIYPIF